MAQVFQCDACGKTPCERAGTIQATASDKHPLNAVPKEVCTGCFERVASILCPKPKGPRPAGE